MLAVGVASLRDVNEEAIYTVYCMQPVSPPEPCNALLAAPPVAVALHAAGPRAHNKLEREGE